MTRGRLDRRRSLKHRASQRPASACAFRSDRIPLDEVNRPYSEATPDFCNWEHKYTLYLGLEALASYTHSTVHARYWDRWENVDVQRCVKILTNAKFKGIFVLEYEDGPWDGVDGMKYLFKEVMATL